jgi:hypothetical protein
MAPAQVLLEQRAEDEPEDERCRIRRRDAKPAFPAKSSKMIKRRTNHNYLDKHIVLSLA